MREDARAGLNGGEREDVCVCIVGGRLFGFLYMYVSTYICCRRGKSVTCVLDFSVPIENSNRSLYIYVCVSVLRGARLMDDRF